MLSFHITLMASWNLSVICIFFRDNIFHQGLSLLRSLVMSGASEYQVSFSSRPEMRDTKRFWNANFKEYQKYCAAKDFPIHRTFHLPFSTCSDLLYHASKTSGAQNRFLRRLVEPTSTCVPAGARWWRRLASALPALPNSSNTGLSSSFNHSSPPSFSSFKGLTAIITFVIFVGNCVPYKWYGLDCCHKINF